MRFWLEDRLRPPLPADPWSRDLMSVALLLILAAALIPAWDIAADNFLPAVAGHMASFLLLPALGFLLALRCGAIDLSVWVVSCAAGVVAASLLSSGRSVPVAFAAGIATGLGIGLLHAVLVALLRAPSVVVTVATGMATIWVVARLVPARSIAVPESAFGGWMGWHNTPMLAARVLAVSLVYLLALVGMLAVDYADWRGRRLPRWLGLFVALSASGALSAFGGVVWLFESGHAPVPTRLIDDLRVPAAAVLAGGLFLGRRGRELLAGMNLPAALLICTMWRQEAWVLPAGGSGLAPQMLVLACLAIGAHLAFARYLDARGRRGGWPAVAVVLTVSGIAAVAGAANFHARIWHAAFHAGGVCLWLAGVAAAVLTARGGTRSVAAEAPDGLPGAGEHPARSDARR